MATLECLTRHLTTKRILNVHCTSRDMIETCILQKRELRVEYSLSVKLDNMRPISLLPMCSKFLKKLSEATKVIR